MLTSFSSAASVQLQQQFSPRSLLPLTPNWVWRVEEGIARTLTWLEDGTIITLGLWGPGDVIYSALSAVEPFQVECLSKVDVVKLSLDAWQHRENSLLARNQQLEELLIIRSYKRTDEMLIKLLGWLAKRFGQEVKQGQLLDLRLTHQDIAEILGTTRVTITRILSQFEQQGMIERLPLRRIVLKEEEMWHYEI